MAEGAHKPHAVAPGGIFVRRDAESAQATRDEIVQMVTGAAAEAPVTATSPPVVPMPAPSNGQRSWRAGHEGRRSAGRKPRPETRGRARPAVPAETGRSPEVPLRSQRFRLGRNRSLAASLPADLPEIYEEPSGADPVAPTTGIEVLDSYEQDGIRYYTLRDLRYHKLIHNVTRVDRPPALARRDHPA